MRKMRVTLVIEYDEEYYDPPMYWDWDALLDCATEVVEVREP